MTTVHISNPPDNDHCINIVYVGFAKPKGPSPSMDDRQLITTSTTLRPGESMPVDIFKGYGTCSVHEGHPFVRLIPSNKP